MAEGAGAGVFAETAAEVPAEAARLVESGGLVGDHRGGGVGFERLAIGMGEVAGKASDIGGGGMGAAPWGAEIAPVGAVPIPIGGRRDLDLHGGAEVAAAEIERSVAHVERDVDLVAEEFG